MEAGERLELLSCPGEVRLGPGRGMAALCLCREGQAGDMFYLDKPVALKPGTEFALLPLEEGSAVRLAADRPLERTGSLPTAEPGLIRPTIRVERILTLFYQEKEPGFFFPGERHRPYELIYVDHGRLHNVVGGRDYALGQNQALIVPPDQWHMQYGEEGERVGFINRLLHLRRAAAGGDPAAGAGPGPRRRGSWPGRWRRRRRGNSPTGAICWWRFSRLCWPCGPGGRRAGGGEAVAAPPHGAASAGFWTRPSNMWRRAPTTG